MANPQKENGYTGIANEILDAILSGKFTKRQDRILMIVFRFSYGFSKKNAFIEQLQDFAMYGIHKTVIKQELEMLETLKVLEINWGLGEITFVKDYTKWKILQNKTYNKDRHKQLLKLNITKKKPERKPSWQSYSRGGGRKSKESVGLQNTNLTQDCAGLQNTNPQVCETEIKKMPCRNDTNDLHAPKESLEEQRVNVDDKLVQNNIKKDLKNNNNKSNVKPENPPPFDPVVVFGSDFKDFVSEEELAWISGAHKLFCDLNTKCGESASNKKLNIILKQLIAKHDYDFVFDRIEYTLSQSDEVDIPIAYLRKACKEAWTVPARDSREWE